MATGNTLGRFLPAQAELPSSSYPTFDRRNARLVLNFDADAVETCYFGDVLPSNYAGGGLTLDLYWTAATAVAGATVSTNTLAGMTATGYTGILGIALETGVTNQVIPVLLRPFVAGLGSLS